MFAVKGILAALEGDRPDRREVSSKSSMMSSFFGPLNATRFS
jgi:hypothetical protein